MAKIASVLFFHIFLYLFLRSNLSTPLFGLHSCVSFYQEQRASPHLAWLWECLFSCLIVISCRFWLRAHFKDLSTSPQQIICTFRVWSSDPHSHFWALGFRFIELGFISFWIQSPNLSIWLSPHTDCSDSGPSLSPCSSGWIQFRRNPWSLWALFMFWSTSDSNPH